MPVKNPAAVELGRLGGLKGGAARAANMTPKQRSTSASNASKARWKKLTPAERSEIARKAVQARWDKKKQDDINVLSVSGQDEMRPLV
jgi:hypothetical protein